MELARSGRIQGITCREILDELAAKLSEKFDYPAEDVNETLADLLSFLSLVPTIGELKVVTSDPDDDKILECAVLGKASFVITGDRKHLLPLKMYKGIEIVSPAEFLSGIDTTQPGNGRNE